MIYAQFKNHRFPSGDVKPIVSALASSDVTVETGEGYSKRKDKALWVDGYTNNSLRLGSCFAKAEAFIPHANIVTTFDDVEEDVWYQIEPLVPNQKGKYHARIIGRMSVEEDDLGRLNLPEGRVLVFSKLTTRYGRACCAWKTRPFW